MLVYLVVDDVKGFLCAETEALASQVMHTRRGNVRKVEAKFKAMAVEIVAVILAKDVVKEAAEGQDVDDTVQNWRKKKKKKTGVKFDD
jgi:uncharacterized protein YdbL (DUF1318 family)